MGFLRAAVIRASAQRGIFFLAAALFFFFGLSDFVEAGTGAWWRPWWLLVWKGTILVSLILLYLRYRLAHREQTTHCPIFRAG